MRKISDLPQKVRDQLKPGGGLRRADLTGAGLTGANLSSADIADANLTGAADLYSAALTGTILEKKGEKNDN